MAGIPQTAEELKVELVSEEKYFEDRIGHVERNFSSLVSAMGSISRKTAKMRDRGDRLVKTVQELAAGESGSTKTHLEAVAECFAALEDYRQAQLDRFDTKIIKPLVDYNGTCKKAREEIKTYDVDRRKEVNEQKTLDRTRINDPANRRRITQLQSSLQKARFKRLHSSKLLENHMEGFERKRTQDMKTVMQEYVHVQMMLHAKALELYTIAHQNLQAISEDENVQIFQTGLSQRKRREPTVATTEDLDKDTLPTSSLQSTPQHVPPTNSTSLL